MRPLLPQAKFNFPVLLKLVAVYGIIALIVLLFAVLMVFLVPKLDNYIHAYQWGGMNALVAELKEDFVGEEKEDFVGNDIDFIWMITRSPLLTVLAPLGAGGIVGVIHYIFVRKRRSNLPN